MTRLRGVDAGFVATAPRVLRFTGQVGAPPETVFDEISGDAARWRLWFPGVTAGGYADPPPHGVGSTRWVHVRGAGRYDETIVAWERPQRWAFRVDATTLPLARALVEQWTLRPARRGTELTWTFAVDPQPLFRVGLLAGPAALGAIFDRAVRNLDRIVRPAGDPAR